LVHLLQSYCNRVEATVRLENLLVRAQKDTVERISRPEAKSAKPAPKKLSAAANEAIVAAYEGGARVVDLARQFGVSKWTINHRLNVAGTDHRPNSMSPEQIDRAVALRASGLSTKKIVPIAGFSEGTIWTELKGRKAAES
jgi:transposase-like protein